MSAPPGTMVNMILDRIIKVFQEPNNRKRIQSQCIDPLIKYILNRMFPYIILVCIIFCIILLLSFISVGLLILQLHPGANASIGTSAGNIAMTTAAAVAAMAMAPPMATPTPTPTPTPMATPMSMPDALAESLINTTP
jgi:hypothetical protein